MNTEQHHYRDIIARIPAGVWTARMNGEVLFASEQIEDITGFTADEFVARGAELWARHVHPADIGGLFDGWNEIYSAGQGSLESEYRFLRKDGQWVWLQQRISLIAEADREPYIAGILVDVTARHSAEEELRNSEWRYRTLVEQARDIIFSLDLEGRFLSLNHAFEAISGWPCEEWIGRTFVELVDPSSVSLALARFHATIGGDSLGYSEYQLMTKSGKPITVEATMERVVVGDRAVGAIGIARDVTRRKEADAIAAKESRLASLGQLATSVAHEFNNVLMSINPFAELLQRRFPNEERVTTATRHILDAVRRGREISQRVLRVSRPVKPELESMRVEECLQELADRARAMLGVNYVVEQKLANEDSELTIQADRAMLDQIATILIGNARDAMPGSGTIILGARRAADGGMIEISFEDNGIGMERSTMDHIFEPLFTTKHGGSGLGLTIAYQAMKQQDGSIAAESVAGRGSKFTLTFRENVSEDDSPRRMLIVEDDESVGEGLRVVLEDEGFEIRLVARGLEAEQAVSDFAPDLVLLDMNLPDIAGVDVYDRIHKRDPNLPVIISTGHAEHADVERLRGFNVPSIMKPYDVNELMTVIARLASP